MIKIIAAVSKNGVIGFGSSNSIPWSYPEDTQFFRRMTLNSTIIMGANTFISMGSKPLPKRRNIVITSSQKIGATGVETFPSVERALTTLDERPEERHRLSAIYTTAPVWFIGGRGIYKEGLKYASQMYLTLIPEEVSENSLDEPVFFPWIDVKRWSLKSIAPIENADGSESKLEVAMWKSY